MNSRQKRNLCSSLPITRRVISVPPPSQGRPPLEVPSPPKAAASILRSSQRPELTSNARVSHLGRTSRRPPASRTLNFLDAKILGCYPTNGCAYQGRERSESYYHVASFISSLLHSHSFFSHSTNE